MRLFIISIVLLSMYSVSYSGTLFDWNSSGDSGTTWNGWSYSTDIRGNGSNKEGWKSDLKIQYGTVYGPESFEKNDNHYDKNNPFDNTASIVDGYLGKGFKVYSASAGNSYHPSWWIWYTRENLQSYGRGVTDSNTDRMGFYVYLNDVDSITYDGGKDSVPTRSLTIGTYACWDSGCDDGEGPGNQHYYHYVNVEEGGWWYVQLDRPQIRREGAALPTGPDPTIQQGGPNYFAAFSRFYIELNYNMAQSQDSYYLIDEIEFWNQTETENEAIASLAVGYNPSTGKWGISWQDMAYHDASTSEGNTTHSTFEVRYSTSPITSANYSSATPITPEYYSGDAYTGNTNYIRRPSSWYKQAWTRFELPQSIVKAGTIYFAVKDVSDSNGNNGTQWPWTKVDGRNANSGIKTIKYDLNLTTNGSDKSSPIILKIE